MNPALTALMLWTATFGVAGLNLARGQVPQTLFSFGEGSFIVDEEGATTAIYSQTAGALVFRPSVVLGATIGGTVEPPVAADLPTTRLGLIIKVQGANPNAPFSVELFDATLESSALYTGYTAGAGSSPSFVPLRLEQSFAGDPNEIAGLQFTWDGDANLDVEILALALLHDQPPPEVTPEPDPAPSTLPPASPVPPPAPSTTSPTPPQLSITSPSTTRGKTYRLTMRVTDGRQPTHVQYRLRAPGSRKFGRWFTAAQDGTARLRLPKRGRWQIEMRVTDAQGQTNSKVVQVHRR